MAAIVTVTHDNNVQIIQDLTQERAKELYDILTNAQEAAKWQSDINDAHAMYIILCNVYGQNRFKHLFKGRNGTRCSIQYRYKSPYTGMYWPDGVLSDPRPCGDFKQVEIIS